MDVVGLWSAKASRRHPVIDGFEPRYFAWYANVWDKEKGVKRQKSWSLPKDSRKGRVWYKSKNDVILSNSNIEKERDVWTNFLSELNLFRFKQFTDNPTTFGDGLFANQSVH